MNKAQEIKNKDTENIPKIIHVTIWFFTKLIRDPATLGTHFPELSDLCEIQPFHRSFF